MKTTFDLPDELFREVKATAARRGVLMKQFVAEALREKLAAAVGGAGPPAWTKFTGCMARDPEMRTEVERIDRLVEAEFGRIEEDDWE